MKLGNSIIDDEAIISTNIGDHFSSYLWESVFWELWKENFTENIETLFGVVNILGIEIPQSKNYMILEALNWEEILNKNSKIGNSILDFLNKIKC